MAKSTQVKITRVHVQTPDTSQRHTQGYRLILRLLRAKLAHPEQAA